MLYYVCKMCGNLVEIIETSGVNIMCCGRPMEKILPGRETAEPAEKHLPVITGAEDRIIVEAGAPMHPMTMEHHIIWIAIETTLGQQMKRIPYHGKPRAEFLLMPDEQVVAAYAYCNLHGLWKTEPGKK